ncbi:MAG: tannase/feruloyl esterase family alpha/beta hydrolase [Novosphingobium sp.]
MQSTAVFGEGTEGKPRDPAEGNLTWPTENCDIASVQKMAPANTTIAFAYREGQQACRVDGWVTTQNPGPNRVLFGLTLPNNFNGRYLFQGVGGAAGQLPIPSRTLLAKGYEAVVAKTPNAGDWLRMFFVPGVQHCGGGNGPTDIDDPMVDALATWVETGNAPEAVLAPRATREKGVDRVFRLCPEPPGNFRL